MTDKQTPWATDKEMQDERDEWRNPHKGAPDVINIINPPEFVKWHGLQGNLIVGHTANGYRIAGIKSIGEGGRIITIARATLDDLLGARAMHHCDVFASTYCKPEDAKE